MESTLFVLFASSLSVLFGWQPMPDDDQRVEYIVQIEPELAATLHEGQAIPITCDIPKDIGPVGRVRIVVGREPLPQLSRTVNLKPWPEETAGKGVIQTQFTSPASKPVNTGSRYGNVAGQGSKEIFPPGPGSAGGVNSSAAPIGNPFARTRQAGATEARNLAENAKRQIFPPGEQLFDKSGANSNVRTAMNNSVDKLGNALREDASGLAKQAEGRFRQAANDVGQSAQKSMNEFGRSMLPKSSAPNNGGNSPTGLADRGRDNREILSIKSGNGQSSPQASNAPIYPAKSRRIDRPVYEQDHRQRQETPPMNVAARPPARTPINSAPPNPTSNAGEFLSESAWPDTRVASPVGIASGGSRESEIDLQPARKDNPWPRDYERSHREERRIRNEVGYTPSDRDTNLYGEEPDDFGSSANEGSNQGFGAERSNRSRRAEIREPDYQGELESNSSKSDVFPMLLSWVLLTGSGVGNVYLWWSYADVRRKYRGVVHGSSSRSHDRYDD